MKIGLVNNLYEPFNRGGAEDIVKILADYLSSQGHTVFIISTIPDNLKKPTVKKEKVGKLNIYRIGGYNVASYYNLSKLGSFWRYYWHIYDLLSFKSKVLFKEIVEKEEPDIMWLHNLKGIGFNISSIVKNNKAKYILTIHDVQYYDPSGLLIYGNRLGFVYKLARSIYLKIVKKILSDPDLLISPSQWLLEFYRSKSLFINTKSIQLLNPLPVFNVKETQKIDKTKIVFVGQLNKHKGIDSLVKAINIFNGKEKNKLYLDIYGKGPLEKQIEENEYIELKGWTEFSYIPELLNHYDLVVIPSLCYENSPTTIRIAKQLCLPVLGSDLGGIPELLNLDKGDYLFKPNNIDSLIEELIRFNNRKLSHKLRSVQASYELSVKDYCDTVFAKL